MHEMFRLRTAGLGAVAAAALTLALLLVPSQGLSQGLDLEAAKEKVIEAYDAPNPHFELDCSDCHEGRPSYGRDTRQTVKFVNGENGIVDLCYQCHDTLNEGVRVHSPVEDGECTECHSPHGSDHGSLLTAGNGAVVK